MPKETSRLFPSQLAIAFVVIPMLEKGIEVVAQAHIEEEKKKFYFYVLKNSNNQLTLLTDPLPVKKEDESLSVGLEEFLTICSQLFKEKTFSNKHALIDEFSGDQEPLLFQFHIVDPEVKPKPFDDFVLIDEYLPEPAKP